MRKLKQERTHGTPETPAESNCASRIPNSSQALALLGQSPADVRVSRVARARTSPVATDGSAASLTVLHRPQERIGKRDANKSSQAGTSLPDAPSKSQPI